MVMSRHGLMAFFLITAMVQTLMAANPCTSINAVTSASGKLKLKSGQACATSASVVWNDGYNSGTQHLIKYGTSTSYGSQINLKPFTANADVTTTIPSLNSNTQYYGQFYRTYEGSTYTTNFSFKTTGGTAVRGRALLDALRPFSITVGSASFALKVPAGQPITIAVYSLNGALALERRVSAGKEGEKTVLDFSRGTVPGVYLCKLITVSGMISQKTVIGR